MSKEVVVIGGGVIGLCSAYYLRKAGHDVTVIDKGNITNGASFGNAGMIVPSHLVPIASPGMVSKGLRWMLSQTSPFYIRPRLNSDLIRWGRQFYRSSTMEHIEQSTEPLGDYLRLSKKLFRELTLNSAEYFFQSAGLLIAWQSEKNAAAEISDADIAQQYGLDVRILSKEQIPEVEKNISLQAEGAVYYPGDMHLHPGKFMRHLHSSLEEMGVLFHLNTEVKDLYHNGNRIESVKMHFGKISADEFILAAGAWSGELLKPLGIKLSMMPGKGYTFDLEKKGNQPSVPTILSEGKVAVTPMSTSLRLGGTMEITKLGDQEVRMKRIEGILHHIRQFYPDLKFDSPALHQIWNGYRPCSPDGLPYLGRDNSYSNLIIASGHSMLGLTLGPATGHITNALVSGENPAVKIDLFHPNRKI